MKLSEQQRTIIGFTAALAAFLLGLLAIAMVLLALDLGFPWMVPTVAAFAAMGIATYILSSGGRKRIRS